MNDKPTDSNFSLYVSYSQVGVFDAALENPFNDWTSEFVNQGFAWREGSTSFRTLDEEGNLHVIVKVVEQHQIVDEAERGVRVPFCVPDSGEIEVASITDGQPLSLPAGDYSLFFETWKEGEEMRCNLTFCKEFKAEAKLVKCDSDLSPTLPLRMDAQPA